MKNLFVIPNIGTVSINSLASFEALTSDTQATYSLSADDLLDTIELTNADFVAAAFANSNGQSVPLFHFVKDTQHWGYPTPDCNGSTNLNAYYTVSSFIPEDSGGYSRTKKQFAALHVVVLDDLVPEISADKVTKAQIPFSRVSLEPSYVIETSANNFQVGFFLDQPITDVELVDSLEKQIKEAGLTDTGANGWQTRLMRLPNGINSKNGMSFHCRLRLWKPKNRYSVSEIINGLNLPALEMTAKSKEETSVAKPVLSKKMGSYVWTPKPTHDPVLAALKQRGLFKREIEPGKYEITCPWCNEHTGNIDSGTAYWAPTRDRPIGTFHCMHSHCQGRSMNDLLEYLKLSLNDALMVDKIRIEPNCQTQIVEAVEQSLTATGEFYRYYDQLVRVIKKKEKAEIITLDVSTFLTHTNPFIYWYKRDDRTKGKTIQQANPAQELIKSILNNGKNSDMPILKGIIQQPMLRKDGELVTAQGYDPKSRFFCDFDTSKYNIPSHPTKEDAQQALNHLSGIFSEFAFATEVDRSAAISAAFTATLRSSLDLAPMFLVRAHTKGSGKSYCCSLISAFASEQKVATIAMPKDEDEMGKVITAQIMGNKKIINFDNLVDDIKPYPSLCSLLTSEEIEGRVLGKSQVISGSTKILLLASGNNVEPMADMARRVLTINLDPKEEIPALRQYKNRNLLDEVYENRHLYITDVLTIVRAWIQAGKPIADAPNVGSFNQWSDCCRQPLLWLGLEDPVTSIINSIKYDPQQAAEGRLITLLQVMFQSDVFRAHDIVEEANHCQNGELREALNDLDLMNAGVPNSRSIGRWLSRKEGVRFDGVKLACMDKRKKTYKIVG